MGKNKRRFFKDRNKKILVIPEKDTKKVSPPSFEAPPVCHIFYPRK